MWAAALQKNSADPPPPQLLAQRLDARTYEKISHGMSRDEVYELIRAQPTTTLHAISPKDKVSEWRTCWWHDQQDGTIKVLFYRDCAVEKFCYGLQ